MSARSRPAARTCCSSPCPMPRSAASPKFSPAGRRRRWPCTPPEWLAADVLAPLNAGGTAIGGFHPLRAFPTPESAVEAAAGVFFALDGDPRAVALGRRLALAFGGSAAVISQQQRPLYHLVATLTAGAVTTVAAVAMEIAGRSGLPAEVRARLWRTGDRRARQGAGADRSRRGYSPARRRGGTSATFLFELAELARIAPEAAPIVVALARESLRQRSRWTPPDPPRQALAELLAGADLLDLTKDRVLTSSRKPSG